MAGTIKTNAVQLGDSATATQNFTLRTNVDGTATLARGNVGTTTQDILTIDASGKVTLIQNAQTWQDTTGSTTSGVAKTNSTGVPIKVSVYSTSAVAAVGTASISVNGVVMSYQYMPGIAGAPTVTSAYAEVPAGAQYTVTWTGASVVVKELK